MEQIVISVGGSLFAPVAGKIDTNYVREFCRVIVDNIADGRRFFLVTGGGGLAGEYIDAAKGVAKVDQDDQDWIGIHTTRLHGHFFRTVLKELAHPEIITTPTDVLDIQRPVVIAAGWRPGRSTDYVAVEVANTYGASHVINLTNQDFVYDKDPAKFPDATPIERIAWEHFRRDIVGYEWKPRMNAPFDPIASEAAEEYGLKVSIANGRNFSNLEKLLRGDEDVVRTLIE